MNNIVGKLVTGGSGFTLLEITPQMPIDDIFKCITQIIVAVATLIALFKKNKNNDLKKEENGGN